MYNYPWVKVAFDALGIIASKAIGRDIAARDGIPKPYGFNRLQALPLGYDTILDQIRKEQYTEDIKGYGKVYHVPIIHRKSDGLEGFTILHLSDTHFKDNKKQRDKLQAYRDYLDDKVFDVIVLTGDVVKRNASDIKDYHLKFLSAIKAQMGKYFVLGNHDYYLEGNPHIPNFRDADTISSLLSGAGFTELRNKCVHLMKSHGSPVTLVGVDEVKPDSRVTDNISENIFTIALVHNLDRLTNDFSPIFDLVLSGHLHDSEINLGIIDGRDLQRKWDAWQNVNSQSNGLKFLTERTLSYISPGFHSHVAGKWGIPRIQAETEGISILTIRAL